MGDFEPIWDTLSFCGGFCLNLPHTMIARDVEGKVDWFSAGAGQIECLNGEMIGFDKTGIMVRIFSLHFKEIFGNYFNKNKSVDL